MNLNDELEGLKSRKEWDKAIELIQDSIEATSNNSWVYIVSIYFIHNLLLEEDYPEEKQEDLCNLLQRYFKESKEKFSENLEYLFFIGKILHIAEWYFGLNDNRLAFKFQEKAKNGQPNNLLYEWAYRLSCNGDITADYLAHQIIENEPDIIFWLKTKSFPGAYVLEHLVNSNNRYINHNLRLPDSPKIDKL